MRWMSRGMRKYLPPWLWFAALYAGALLAYAALTLPLYLIMAR